MKLTSLKNKVKGAPIYICKDHLSNKKAQAIIINSGNANTCNGDDGLSCKIHRELSGIQLEIEKMLKAKSMEELLFGK